MSGERGGVSGAGGGGVGGGGGGGAVVGDQDIAEALQSLLREGYPNNPALNSLSGVVQQLESKLGIDLPHKIDFIRSQIQFLFQPQLRHHPMLNFQYPQKDHFALHQHPGFQPHISGPSLSHLQFQVPGFSVSHPQEYVVRPPPPPQPRVVATSAAPAPAGDAEAAKESAPSGRKRRGGPGGLNKLCGVSPELQPIVGQATMPRTEIVRQLWAYIRKYNLQDPNNKRKIICNDELRVVFETDCTDMFKMNKLLAKHIIPLEPSKQTAQNAKKAKTEVETGGEGVNSVPIVVISEALASLLGTEERQMSQAEVLRQVWEYVKLNQLEDPLNSMVIMCDAKLQELFGCESISALGIPEMLARHHLFRKT